MNGNRKKEIRQKADEFRNLCKVNRYSIINLFQECGRFGYKLIRYPIAEDGNLGFSYKKNGDIIIFTNSSVRLSRELFTLAHEIGHVMLHLERRESFLDDIGTISEKSEDIKEQEANFFAANLLMPQNAVNDYFDFELNALQGKTLSAYDVAKMMSAFNVSFEMVLNRLEVLGKIAPDERICLDNEKNKKRVGNLLRATGGNAMLNIAANEISMPPEYLDYAIYNYNHKAIPKETLERVLDCYHLTLEDIKDEIKIVEEEHDLDELIRRMEE